MYFLQRRHSPYHPAQLLRPTFAYMLANPEERMKSCPKKCTQSRPAPKTCGASFANTYLHVAEEDENYLLFTDIPGVKQEDVKVELTEEGALCISGERKQKDKEPTKFERQFLVDDKLIETSQITATLVDGTLQIVAPKRETPKPRRVAVVAGTPTEDDSALSFEVDVPGVKVDALQVEVDDDGKLIIVGERKRGKETTTLRKAFTLNRRVVDTETVEAVLEDGVLTIQASKKEPFVGRVIPVNSSDNAAVEEKETREEEATNEKALDDESPAATQEEEEEDDFHEVQATEDSTEEGDKSADDESKSSESEFEVVPETVAENDE